MPEFKRIGIVGAGSMGTSMALGFSEHDLQVSLWDINPKNIDGAMSRVENEGKKSDVEGYHDIQDFVKSFGDSQKLFLLSITHGKPADAVIAELRSSLREGDIIIDAGNEHYRSTERRQREMSEIGVHWIGMGVSGGYQSARRGPSMCPGGDKEAIESILPLLSNFAAKDPSDRRPCIDYMGPRGAGHYIKMCHNGIETGILAGVCEAWGLLRNSLGLDNDEIGKIFEDWISSGDLKNNFLLQIGSEISQKKKSPDGDKGRGEGIGEGKGTSGHVLDDVLDKVVQDADNSEGTFFWTASEAALRHVSTPTISASQFFRVASADRAQRLKVAENLKSPQPRKDPEVDKEKFVELLRKAVYASMLSAYCQGLELIARASQDEGWDIDLSKCTQIWRNGCIIRSDHILDLFQQAFSTSSSTSQKIINMKLISEVACELSKNYPALKGVVLKATEWDAYVPSLSASLEYRKYCGGEQLPTQFMEAEMDFFGWHSYDRWGVEGEDPGKVEKGKHHYEWRPA